MNICLFDENEIDKPLSLRDERGQHIIKILHKNEGDTFSAGITGKSAGTATITKINRWKSTTPDGKKEFDDGEICFTFTAESDGKPLFPLAMIIGFPRPIQLKRLLRDMAALGVCEIHLTGTELGEKSYMKSDLATTDAGKEMLRDGTVQAASTHIPEIFMHQNLSDCIKCVKERMAGASLLALDNIEPEKSLSAAVSGGIEKAVAAIGSERGWTEKERSLMKEEGFTLLSMGSRVMRTETAATVAASLILSAEGALF